MPTFFHRAAGRPGQTQRAARVAFLAQEGHCLATFAADKVDRCARNHPPALILNGEMEPKCDFFEVDAGRAMRVGPNELRLDLPAPILFAGWFQRPSSSGRRVIEFKPAIFICLDPSVTGSAPRCIYIEIGEGQSSGTLNELNSARRGGIECDRQGRRRRLRGCTAFHRLDLCRLVLHKEGLGARGPNEPCDEGAKQANSQAKAKSEGAGVGQVLRLGGARPLATNSWRSGSEARQAPDFWASQAGRGSI